MHSYLVPESGLEPKSLYPTAGALPTRLTGASVASEQKPVVTI